MIFLASEHKGEIEPLFDHFPFKKLSDHYTFENLILYVNHGKGALSLAFKCIELINKYDITLALLFGYAGCVSNCEVGEIVSISKIKLLDRSLNPTYNPIDLKDVEGFDSVEAVTLIDGFNFNNSYLSLFGDCVDNESYFFAKALKSINKPCYVIRVISDKNDRESLFKARSEKLDISKLIEFVKFLLWVDKDDILSELFINTGFVDRKKLLGLKKLINNKFYTFTKRQFLYRRIVINGARCSEKPFELKGVFIEKGVDRERINFSLENKSVYKIDDYIPVFHNLKDRKAIIFASKRGELLRETPKLYTPDGSSGYSILSQYNCIYDCSYCFLKGYFRSFNPVIFLNYEDYFKAIEEVLRKDTKRPLYFYTGTFSDPVALSFTNNFLLELINLFRGFERNIFLEIRTKSDRIDTFLHTEPTENVIFAFSLSPKGIAKKYEFFAPSIERRIGAIRKLDEKGFKIGIRLDPIFCGFLKEYGELFEYMRDLENLHSIEVGFLRFDKNDYKNMLKKEPCVLRGLRFERGMYRYPNEIIDKTLSFLKESVEKFYLSMEY